MSYQLRQKPHLIKLVESPEHKFYYTEGTKLDYLNRSRFAPLRSNFFTYIKSPLDEDMGIRVPQLFIEKWRKQFSNRNPMENPFINVTQRQLNDMGNFVLIMMEAKHSQDEAELMAREAQTVDPSSGLPSAAPLKLLMDNPRLYRLMFQRDDTKAVIQDTIRLLSLDHEVPDSTPACRRDVPVELLTERTGSIFTPQTPSIPAPAATEKRHVKRKPEQARK